MLAEVIPDVFAADKNSNYMKSGRLENSSINCYCFDFDSDFPEGIKQMDAIVCFETIEHLRDPFAFLGKITMCLKEDGWLLLSFPNAIYERLDSNNKNMDPYHLHILKLEEVCATLSQLNYEVQYILGQPICNCLCSIQHNLKEAGLIDKNEVDMAFRHNRKSIMVLSRLIAYPTDKDVDSSYSYLIVAKKQPRKSN